LVGLFLNFSVEIHQNYVTGKETNNRFVYKPQRGFFQSPTREKEVIIKPPQALFTGLAGEKEVFTKNNYYLALSN